MPSVSPVDELAEIRAEIARLQLREAALLDLILRHKGEAMAGRWFRAQVTETRQVVFDARLLPPQIRDDPQFRRERVTQALRCVPLRFAPPPRTGWPIERAVPLQ